jgi:pilus assembly protein CpaB
VDVLVAAKDLEQGELLGDLAVDWRGWPRDGVTPDMITREALPEALEQMAQARARLSMVNGEPIVAAKIVRPGDRGFMSAIVPEGMRAIAVPIGENTAVSGFVLPNDRVDVIFTRQVTARTGDKDAESEIVMTNVKVLAINQALKAGADGATITDGRNAVIEVNPQQAEILTKLSVDGTLSLALRSLAEGGAAGNAGGPQLADSLRNPRRAASGPLVIRYGFERTVPNR